MQPVRFTGQVWLNGEFGVSRQRETPFHWKRENDYRCPIHREVMQSLIAGWGVLSVLDWVLTGKGLGGVAAFGSSNVAKPHKPRKRRGEGGITALGRKMLRNAATLLERQHGKHTLSFLTLTVPGCTAGEYEALVADWSEVVRKALQNLRRRLLSKGLTGELLSCCEIQEKRGASGGLPALHLHVVFQGKVHKKSSWVLTPKWCRRMWKSILSPILPSVSDWSAVENLKRVQKSASAYLGKYMSKGAGAVATLVAEGKGHLLPSAWWNCTFSLRRKVRAEMIVSHHIADGLIKIIDEGKFHWFVWLHPVDVVFKDGGKFRVGWAGKLHDWAYQILKYENRDVLDRRGKISLAKS